LSADIIAVWSSEGAYMSRLRKPVAPTPVPDLLREAGRERLEKVLQAAFAQHDQNYHHWDKLRYLKPPGDLSHAEWWLATKLARSAQLKALPLRDRNGNPFYFSTPDAAQEMLHKIDQQASGTISISEEVTNPATRDRYIVSSLIEEAITSSQLEGAATTRRVAKEMLRSGRAPRDRHERMIRNNFLAMQRIGELRNERLTPDLVFEIHRMVTQDTLNKPDAAGRLQRPNEPRVKVWDDEKVLHDPPAAAELPARMDAMCDFANGVGVQGFIHPVVRAVTLHFWTAYDHPFEDGNGRTARALFYWSMLSQGYWLAEFLSISRILLQAPAQYARSFLYTESDDNDLTYFLLYQLGVLRRAVEELRDYLSRKMAEVRDAENLIKASAVLNHRQLAILSRAVRVADTRFTAASHRLSHRVSYETARTDLLDLERKGLLTRRRRGHAYYFAAHPELKARLRELE
jgi:Fic family protein